MVDYSEISAPRKTLSPAHSSALRIGRNPTPNAVFLVTFVTRARRPVLNDLLPARIVARILNTSPHGKTLAYVVMPDHVHWLLQLDHRCSLSEAVRAAKSLATRAINQLSGTNGTIWQAGFHDHGVRHEEAVREIARYVVANPIRAKLVKRVGDYPFWDAIWL